MDEESETDGNNKIYKSISYFEKWFKYTFHKCTDRKNYSKIASMDKAENGEYHGKENNFEQ